MKEMTTGRQSGSRAVAASIIGVALFSVILAGDPAAPAGVDTGASAREYIGALACGECHADQLKAQSRSEHAQALSRPLSHPLASQFTPASSLLLNDRYRFQFSRDGDELRLHAWDESQEINMPVEWAFGAGAKAVTFVSRISSGWYLEHALSFYSGSGQYGVTPGQSSLLDAALAAAIGKPTVVSEKEQGVLQCFRCHSTGPVSVDPAAGLQPHEEGIRCEVCHGPGSAHREAARVGNVTAIRGTIRNPVRMSSAELNRFCGNCHRQPAPAGTEIDWSISWNVRHEPVYLSQSACFRRGKLSCLTCHEPHDPMKHDSGYYNSKCSACHSKVNTPSPKPVCLADQSANCIDCHMPRISPQSFLTFTNHWIGIYGPGNKLKPLKRP
jgi:hypothetical protein